MALADITGVSEPNNVASSKSTKLSCTLLNSGVPGISKIQEPTQESSVIAGISGEFLGYCGYFGYFQNSPAGK